ncbi:hypothetical protein D3C85_1402700 [compost metagenome]
MPGLWQPCAEYLPALAIPRLKAVTSALWAYLPAWHRSSPHEHRPFRSEPETVHSLQRKAGNRLSLPLQASCRKLLHTVQRIAAHDEAPAVGCLSLMNAGFLFES